MGLSIHYSGIFDPNRSLEEMIDEVVDIATIFGWPFKIYERSFPGTDIEAEYNKEIYGLHVIPPESEPIWLCFLSNGRMASPVSLHFWRNANDAESKQLLHSLFTKTQYAGIHVHIQVVELIRYISRKYFREFSLFDEGQYWETGDKLVLEKKFAEYNYILNQVTSGLQNFPMKPGEDFEIYFERLLIHIKNKQV